MILVENDEPVVGATRRLLERWGARVIATKSGGEAVRKSTKGTVKPGLVIAEFGLPGGENGAQAIKRIRDNVDKSLPAIVIADDTSPAALREISRARLAVLHKPIEPAKLRSLVRHLGPKTAG